jgi:hypothetical protein
LNIDEQETANVKQLLVSYGKVFYLPLKSENRGIVFLCNIVELAESYMVVTSLKLVFFIVTAM